MKFRFHQLLFMFLSSFPLYSQAETINGTGGGDTIDVSDSSQPYEIYGNGGADLIKGSPQDDVIAGGYGNDVLYGMDGNDTLSGGAGNDELYGSEGNDTFTVTGIAGYDIINGGLGIDIVMGSNGDDEIGFLSLSDIEIIDGGPGHNLIKLASGGRVLDLSSATNKNIDHIIDGWGNDIVVGTSGDDDFVSAHGNDQIDGGAGYDTAWYPYSYYDYEVTENNPGIVYVYDSTKQLGKDEYTNIERIIFTDGQYESGIFIPDNGTGDTPPVAKDDTVSTVKNVPVTIDALANDIDVDGDLINLVTVQSANNGITSINSDGTIDYLPKTQFTGIDSFTYSISDSTGRTSQANVTINVLSDIPESIILLGTGGVDNFNLSDSFVPYEIHARGGYDVITGSQADDIIYGEFGNDIINGYLGDDLLIGGAGNDEVNGATGDDIILISGLKDGYDAVDGGEDIDTLSGSEFDDVIGLQSITQIEIIDGGQGYNVIKMASGGRLLDLSGVMVSNIDLIQGGSGNDSLLGSDSDDVFAGGRSNDLIDGKAGFDTVVYDGQYIDYQISEQSGVFTIYDTYSNDGRDTLKNIELIKFVDKDFLLSASPINSEPVAINDITDAEMNKSVNIDVLFNDYDPDGDMLYIESYSLPAHGVVIYSDVALLYTPDNGYIGLDSFSYTIIDNNGLTAQAMVLVTIQPEPIFYSINDLINDIPSASWKKINLNRFDDVWAPKDQRPVPTGYTIGAPDRVISAWSSMAIDSRRSRLIFFGGGHANYSGNEIYLFDLNTRHWERGSLPSDVINLYGDGQFFAVDGAFNAPASAHTYDNQLYLPRSDRFVTFGGAKFYNDKIFVKDDGITPTGPYFWDPNLVDANKVGGTTGSHVKPEQYPDVSGGQMWENRDTIYSGGAGEYRPDGFVNGTTAYAEEDGKDVVYLSESPRSGGDLFKYTVNDINDPTQDIWEIVGVMDNYAGQGSGAYDPFNNIYVRNANLSTGFGFVYWDLNFSGPFNMSYSFNPIAINGKFEQSDLFGMDYDILGQRFVLWDGGANVWYMMPPSTGVWTDEWSIEKTQAYLSPETPQQTDGVTYKANGAFGAPFRGVLGKWKYSQQYNVFFGVLNPYSGDVWMYKP